MLKYIFSVVILALAMPFIVMLFAAYYKFVEDAVLRIEDWFYDWKYKRKHKDNQS